MGYRLKVVGGINQGRSFTVSSDELTIGRVEGNHLVVFGSGVSRQHAVIRKTDGGYKISDLGSSNGTLVNGAPVREAVLKDGDLITIGDVPLRFAAGEGSAFPREDTVVKRLPGAGKASGGRRVAMKIAAAVAALAALALVVLYVVRFMDGGTATVQDHSTETFPLTMQNYELKFGYGAVDVQCMNRCNFSFIYNEGRAVLSYAVKDVPDREMVEVQVNGVHVGFAPPAQGEWLRGLHLALPKTILKAGGENKVVFINRRNPAAKAPWGLAFVKVFEEPLPAPNSIKAAEFLELAHKKYAEKDVALGNLYQALAYLRLSRDYMDGLEPKPDIYSEAGHKLEMVAKELQEQFDNMMFSAQKALQFGDRKKSAEILEKVLKVFPDADDQRYQEAQQLLRTVK